MVTTTYEATANFGERIDLPRLCAELALSDAVLEDIAALDIPASDRVTSTSLIKTGTVSNVLHIVSPAANPDVLGVKTLSEVPEQPFGQQTIDGCLNRLRNGIRARESIEPGEANRVAWFSLENGLFRVARRGAATVAAGRHADNVVQFTEGADMATAFDTDADYADRAVAAIRLPGRPTVVCVSPEREAVIFPREAVLAAHGATGGFERNTAGAWMAAMGMVTDKQNPHRDLTRNRQGGILTREDQMARVLLRALVRLSREFS